MDKLFILYGEQNAGKTSTLRKVLEMLTGYTLLKSHGPQKDLRVIFNVGDKTVFMATYGDDPGVIRRNFAFFNKSKNFNTAYELIDGELKKIENSRYQELTPDLCISACRIYKNGQPNIIYDEVNKQIMDCMPIIGGIQWIAKTQSTVKRSKRRDINTDLETALTIVAEIIQETIV